MTTRSSTSTVVERRSYSSRLVFGVLAASLALAFVLALYIHGRFARFKPRAVVHLPARVESVVWLNVEQTIGFDVFKQAVLPVLEFGRKGLEPRAKHLERKTSLELEVDTREFVFAQVDSTSWLAIAGGLYRRDKLKEGLVRLFTELGIPATQRGELVVTQGGYAFGVAEDGVLLASNVEAVAAQALIESMSPGSEWKSLLHKPGTLMNVMGYGEIAHFGGVPVCKESSRRCWLSLEPGDPLHLFFERVAPGSEVLRPDDLPFKIEALHAHQGPQGVMTFTATVDPLAFWDRISAWQSELTEIVW